MKWDRVGTWWKGLALWARWAIVSMPLWMSWALHGLLGAHVLWILIPGCVLVVLHVLLTWDDIGDTLRSHIGGPKF